MSIIEEVFNIIAPHQCLGCDTEGSIFCLGCISFLPRVPSRCYKCKRLSDSFVTCSACRKSSTLEGVKVFTAYQNTAKDLVYKLKFERAKSAAGAIANAMSDLLGDKDVIVVHIPTANSRVRERGYDQSELIAQQLSKQAGLVHATLLARKDGLRQLGQSRQVRIKQLNDAFRTLNSSFLASKHVLLVDDVITTGATLEAAARVLKKAGVKHVSAMVFAAA